MPVLRQGGHSERGAEAAGALCAAPTGAAAEEKPQIGIFIGPEGGFTEEEITFAQEKKVCPLSLGKRILRTETAGMAILSVLMYHLEERG